MSTDPDAAGPTPPGSVTGRLAAPRGPATGAAAPRNGRAAPDDPPGARKAEVRALGSGDPGARREVAVVLLACAGGGGLALVAASRAWLRVTAPRPAPLPEVSLALSGRELEPLVAALGVVGLAGVVGLLATRRSGRLAVGVLLAVAGAAVLARSLPHLAAPGAAGVRDLLADAGRAGGVRPDARVTATVAPWWPLLSAFGGLLLAAGGAGVVLRSRRWPTLSTRYERRPAGATPSTPTRRPAARSADRARSATPPPPGDPPRPSNRPPPSESPPPGDAALWEALDGGDDPTAADHPGDG